MRNERRKMKVMERSRRSEETLSSCMDVMTQNTRASWAMRCVHGVSMTTETEQGLRRLTLRAHSRVHQVCHVIVGFRVLYVDLGFHVVICVRRPTVQRQLHGTTHTQFQVQSSFLLDVVVRLRPVIINSICIPKFLHKSHRENGSFEALSWQSSAGPCVLQTCCVIFETLMICFCWVRKQKNHDLFDHLIDFC